MKNKGRGSAEDGHQNMFQPNKKPWRRERAHFVFGL